MLLPQPAALASASQAAQVDLFLPGSWQHCDEPGCCSQLKNPQACIHFQLWKQFSLSQFAQHLHPASKFPLSLNKRSISPSQRGLQATAEGPEITELKGLVTFLMRLWTKHNLTALEISLPLYCD